MTVQETTEAKRPWLKTNKKFMLVRYGHLRHLGLFEHNLAQVPKVRTHVVVKTDRGLELGLMVGHWAGYKAGRFRFEPDQMAEYYKAAGMECGCDCVGRFVRFATATDLSEYAKLGRLAIEEAQTCQQMADELGLQMKIVDAEHILGGERIIVYFSADGRVDFRELVRRLSAEFRTRIEMKQIGARDQARLLGDVESCGQECCCRRFLRYLKPVNMRMAKIQKATLDPAKISGYCGRLRCCLRYEDSTYLELKARLPKKNTLVLTNKGRGRVVDGQILAQLVLVELEDGHREAFPVEDVRILQAGEPDRAMTDEADVPEDDQQQ
ncbi:MAG: regulatory iron-sulfur-containing complex subunit RicT [Sedimentisphaerales bacterium]|jgi:cell fate regulator YaaT (PSP1 superfamily)|nr:regulatory iron-sulfur-containing complex subunit RicT [Sedimentisphaerales bacterium]